MNNSELIPNPTKIVVRHRLSRGTGRLGLRTTIPHPIVVTLVCFLINVILTNYRQPGRYVPESNVPAPMLDYR